MLNVTTSRSSRRLLMAAALVVVVGVASGAPLRAQQGRAGQSPSPQAAPAASLQLSMDQSVAMALETNLGLKSDRLTVDMASQNIASAHAAYLPTLSSSFSRNTQDSVAGSFIESTASVVTSSRLSVGSSLQQALPWYGSRYSVNWSANRNETTGFSTFNPTIGSTLTLQFVQPLWRNFRVDAARVGVESSERQHTIADLTLQQQIIQTQALVRQAYLRLIGAIASLGVAHENMSIAQESLRNARAKIAVGTAAEIDAIQAQATVASNQETVIVYEASVSSAEDQLRALILDSSRPDYWEVHIEPTDQIQVNPREIDLNAAIKNALANRLDLIVARRSIELTDLSLRLGEDQVRPSVDFQAVYSASGTGGTQFQYGSGFPPPVISQSNKGFGSVLGDAFGGAYPSWTVGVTVGYPLGQTAARASLARTHLQAQQEQINLRDLELGVMTSVRDAARQVKMNYQRVLATQAAREANERQYEAEQRRAAAGVATTFDVLLKSSFLAQARTSELQAKIAYNQSLIDFERVQRIR
jgi:outer membrane protein TolC